MRLLQVDNITDKSPSVLQARKTLFRSEESRVDVNGRNCRVETVIDKTQMMTDDLNGILSDLPACKIANFI